MNWITAEEVLIIHVRVIDATGGAHGVVNMGALDSAIQRPFTAFGGVELYGSLVEKVAAMVHSLVAFHPFVDGNKRTALVAVDVCLRLNEHRLVPSAEVEPFFWSVARGEQDIPQIASWLTGHVERWNES